MKGSAGIKDPVLNKKASDIYIELELAGQGGIIIDLKAQFGKLFGSHIKRAIEDALKAQQIEHARVYAEDYGALDFIVRARVNSAARQAKRALQ